MHAIDGPVLRRGDFHSDVEHRLERHERRAGFLGHAPRRRSIAGKRFDPRVVHKADIQHERLTNQKLYVGKRVLRTLYECPVIRFVFFERPLVAVLVNVSEVIHADEDAQHVRLEVEAIGLPPVGQLIHFVAADAAVENLQACVRYIDQQLRGGEPGVSIAHRSERIGLAGRVAVAAGVGDRIALK
jgi:hypothetical protein